MCIFWGSLSKIIEKVTNGVFNSIGLEFTNIPKHEVSYGLLVDKFGAKDLNVKERSHETILGEDVLIDKSKYGFFEPPSIGYPLITYGVHGGALWAGGAVNPKTNKIIIGKITNFNEVEVEL